jgi:hypothetical protein
MPYYGKSSDADLLDGFDSTYFAPLVSPSLTGTPTAPTTPASTNTTQLATTAMVHSAIANDLHATGSAPMYACRAWVNFDGTQSTPTIRASGNVSSITKNGTGDYTVNFTTAMPDANYSASLSGGYPGNTGDQGLLMTANASRSISSIRVAARNSNAYVDYLETYVSIFR